MSDKLVLCSMSYNGRILVSAWKGGIQYSYTEKMKNLRLKNQAQMTAHKGLVTNNLQYSRQLALRTSVCLWIRHAFQVKDGCRHCLRVSSYFVSLSLQYDPWDT